MRLSIAVIASVLVAMPGTAQPSADGHYQPEQIIHDAPIPCSVLCPHWDLEDNGRICNGPNTPGTYDQTYFGWLADSELAFAGFIIEPTVDYDIFVCSATEPSVLVSGANLVGTCSGLGVPGVPIGCRDQILLSRRAVLEATQGSTDAFFLRSFNWSDIGPAPIQVWGPIQITDDDFEGIPLPRPGAKVAV